MFSSSLIFFSSHYHYLLLAYFPKPSRQIVKYATSQSVFRSRKLSFLLQCNKLNNPLLFNETTYKINSLLHALADCNTKPDGRFTVTKINILSPFRAFLHAVSCLLVLLLPHLIEHPVFHKGWHKSMRSGEFHRNKQFL